MRLFIASRLLFKSRKSEKSFLFIFKTSTKRSIIESIIFSTKKQILKSNSIIIFMSSLQFNQSIVVVSFFSILFTTRINISNIELISSTSIFNALKRHFELRYRLDFSDSLKLLIMKCMKNVIDFQQILKSRSYKKTMNDLNREKWIKIIKKRKYFFLINEIWKLINFFKDRRVFRDKWVYKIKKKNTTRFCATKRAEWFKNLNKSKD
jgi:hypothetical protein